jgi:hypothetical protein
VVRWLEIRQKARLDREAIGARLLRKLWMRSRPSARLREAEIMTEQKWWSWGELSRTSATVWPEDLLAMLATVANLQN